MSDITRVALDAMGGDHAPAEMVKGAIPNFTLSLLNIVCLPFLT